MSKASGGTRTVSSANAAASRTFAKKVVSENILQKIYDKNPTLSKSYLKDIAEQFVKEGKSLDTLIYDKEVPPITKVGKYNIETKNGKYEVTISTDKGYTAIKGTSKSDYKSQKFYQIKKDGAIIFSQVGEKNGSGNNVLAPKLYKEEFKKIFK